MPKPNGRDRDRLTRKPGSKRRFYGAAMTGAVLRAARLRAGVSQKVLANEAGYSVIYLGSLETGRSRIVNRTASILTAALDRIRTSRGKLAR